MKLSAKNPNKERGQKVEVQWRGHSQLKPAKDIGKLTDALGRVSLLGAEAFCCFEGVIICIRTTKCHVIFWSGIQHNCSLLLALEMLVFGVQWTCKWPEWKVELKSFNPSLILNLCNSFKKTLKPILYELKQCCVIKEHGFDVALFHCV